MKTIQLPASTANMGPGFDSMGAALTCYNTISFEVIDKGLVIDLEPQDRNIIPADSRNLIYRTFCRTLQKYGVPIPGLHFSQHNKIPPMRGMGSSSACIVGGVAMADYVMGNVMTQQDMLDICALEEGHPDNVLPTILGGIVVGCIEGEHVRYVRVDPPKGLQCAVFVPNFSLSTRKARAALPETVPLKDAVFNLSHAALLAAALAKGDLSLLHCAMQDRLHQPYRMPLVPEFEKIVEIALAQGALSVCLSGAGSTMIAFLENGQGFAQAVEPQLTQLKNKWELQMLQIDTQGFQIR